MDRTLAGKVCLVTGASRGIGASTAAHLAQRGGRVVLAARNEGALAKVTTALAEIGAEALPVVCDVGDPAQVQRLYAEARERFGPVEIAVHNAAILRQGDPTELSLSDWEAMLRVNLSGVFYCCREALAHMRPQRRGVIVNVSSVSALPQVSVLPGLSAYAATKGGVSALSAALAASEAQHGIRVLTLSPGSVNTPMLHAAAPEHAASAMKASEAARAIALLVSDEAAAFNSTNLALWGPPRPGATGA